jgi:hypothetical protein
MTMMLQGGPFIAPIAGLHRLTVKQYHKMITNGVFAEDERVELIDGLLVDRCRTTPFTTAQSV